MIRLRPALAAAGSVLALTLPACGSDEPEDTAASGSPAVDSSPAGDSADEEPAPVPVSDGPFGEGCSAVPADGEGSFGGMADDPVVTAAGNTPALSSLVAAITAADLVDTLNGLEDITVLAPANPAFEAVPADALEALLGDTPQLTAVLTHHVLEGRLGPDQLAGDQTTINGGTVSIDGSGGNFSIAAEGTVLGASPASVICGNVQTANATVYIIDQVLVPPAA